MPKGIMRIAVPLPCFVDMVKLQRVAWQRPQQGTKSCRMGSNFIRLSVRLSVRLSILLWLALRPLLADSQTLMAGPQTLRVSLRGLRACWRSLRAC